MPHFSNEEPKKPNNTLSFLSELNQPVTHPQSLIMTSYMTNPSEVTHLPDGFSNVPPFYLLIKQKFSLKDTPLPQYTR